MRKLLVVLVMLLAVSCSKDEDCNCVKSVYNDDVKLTLIEEYDVECTDEITYRDYISDNLVIIKCY